LQPNFDPEPQTFRIHRCKYVSQCKARSCLTRATLIAEKVDTAAVTFAKSNCVCCSAKSSLSASERAGLRLGTDATNSARRSVFASGKKRASVEEPRQPERQLGQRGAKPQPAPPYYQCAARASIYGSDALSKYENHNSGSSRIGNNQRSVAESIP
jgi:hypothetical protein